MRSWVGQRKNSDVRYWRATALPYGAETIFSSRLTSPAVNTVSKERDSKVCGPRGLRTPSIPCRPRYPGSVVGDVAINSGVFSSAFIVHLPLKGRRSPPGPTHRDATPRPFLEYGKKQGSKPPASLLSGHDGRSVAGKTTHPREGKLGLYPVEHCRAEKVAVLCPWCKHANLSHHPTPLAAL